MKEVYGRGEEYDLYNYTKIKIFLRTPDKQELAKILEEYNKDNNPNLELRIILESLKNDIFTDDLKIKYLNHVI